MLHFAPVFRFASLPSTSRPTREEQKATVLTHPMIPIDREICIFGTVRLRDDSRYSPIAQRSTNTCVRCRPETVIPRGIDDFLANTTQVYSIYMIPTRTPDRHAKFDARLARDSRADPIRREPAHKVSDSFLYKHLTTCTCFPQCRRLVAIFPQSRQFNRQIGIIKCVDMSQEDLTLAWSMRDRNKKSTPIYHEVQIYIVQYPVYRRPSAPLSR